jgi:hypothetical protein
MGWAGDDSHVVGFEVFMVVTMKNVVFWDVAPCGFILVDVSDNRITSIFRVTEIPRESKSVRR